MIKGSTNTNEVEAELCDEIDAGARSCPAAHVAVSRLLLAEPLKTNAGSMKLAELLCRHARAVMGEPIEIRGVPLYTDARHYAAKGVPVVLFGAGPHTIEEANAHRADERLRVTDLYKTTEVVALTLLDLFTQEAGSPGCPEVR